MTQVNVEQARINMIEQQIRTWDVLDDRVLDVLARTPREDFVPPAMRNLAFTDCSIPLGHDEVMMSPKLEGRLLQALSVSEDDRVLEVGTGSGYVTACLARLARHVHSVDIHEDFVEAARGKLKAHGIDNVTLETGDAARGWPKHAPYDVIAVTGSVPELQPDFERELAIGGRLFVIVGELPIMEGWLITRVSDDDWARESLLDTTIPPLVNAPRERKFEF